MSAPVERDVADIARKWVPDPRLGVCEVTLEPGRLLGRTTSSDALDALRRLAAETQRAAEILFLPDASVRDEPRAVTTAALGPLLAEPRITATRLSETVHGEGLTLLERRDGGWLRVRTHDGYHGWTHAGYVATGSNEWADDWDARARARSVGAELRFEDRRFHLAVGGRAVLTRDGLVETADGRRWEVAAGAVRPDAEYRAEARLVAPPEWALRRFSGTPYLWGGRTEAGIDCSGLVQATYAARGVPLPRDSDQQASTGREIAIDPAGTGYGAGDILCFTDGRRISHVALWAGAGRIVHSALARGGVATDELFAETPAAKRLRDLLVAVRRPESPGR